MTEKVSAFFKDIRTIAFISASVSAGGASALAMLGATDMDAQQNGRLSALERSDSSQNIELELQSCALIAEVLPELSDKTPRECAADYLRIRRGR